MKTSFQDMLYWLAFIALCTIALLGATLISNAYADFSQDKALWELNMMVKGHNACSEVQNGANFDEKLSACYYDCISVFKQIGDYTHDSATWNPCVDSGRSVYGSQYVVANGGSVPGYWNFSRGSRGVGDRNVVDLLSHHASYAGGDSPGDISHDPNFQREVAWALQSYIDGTSLGLGPYDRMTPWLENLLYYHQMQFVLHTSDYVKPFMVGISAMALMRYYDEVTPDPRILATLKFTSAGLWRDFWIPASGGFKYSDVVVNGEPTDPAPDLNLLILPMWGWLYKQTGDPLYIQQGDQIFHEGVTRAYLGHGKQFNQNYLFSFKYVAWRNGSTTPTATPNPSPTPTNTRTPTPTATPTSSPTKTATPNVTTTPTKTPTATPISTPTRTPCSQGQTLSSHECRIKRLEGR